MSSSSEFQKLDKRIRADGWCVIRQKGGHVQYKHPTKKGKVTIPVSAGGITKNIQLSVMRQAGIRKLGNKK